MGRRTSERETEWEAGHVGGRQSGRQAKGEDSQGGGRPRRRKTKRRKAKGEVDQVGRERTTLDTSHNSTIILRIPHKFPASPHLIDVFLSLMKIPLGVFQADWSDQFVFNVHARSIFPCEPHSGGITVLFQYPSCILASGDRVRLFARYRANVASLAPPTTLEYVAEQRITRGHHSLKFDCELFAERYVEYCFVYVSQAITGAVADVRMDCVPTLPVSGENKSLLTRLQPHKSINSTGEVIIWCW